MEVEWVSGVVKIQRECALVGNGSICRFVSRFVSRSVDRPVGRSIQGPGGSATRTLSLWGGTSSFSV